MADYPSEPGRVWYFYKGNPGRICWICQHRHWLGKRAGGEPKGKRPFICQICWSKGVATGGVDMSRLKRPLPAIYRDRCPSVDPDRTPVEESA